MTQQKEPFENSMGKGENAGNQLFFLTHNVFYPSQNEFEFFSNRDFVVCKCFEFGPA